MEADDHHRKEALLLSLAAGPAAVCKVVQAQQGELSDAGVKVVKEIGDDPVVERSQLKPLLG